MGILSDSQSLSDYISHSARSESIPELADTITSTAPTGQQGDDSVPTGNKIIGDSQLTASNSAAADRFAVNVTPVSEGKFPFHSKHEAENEFVSGGKCRAVHSQADSAYEIGSIMPIDNKQNNSGILLNSGKQNTKKLPLSDIGRQNLTYVSPDTCHQNNPYTLPGNIGHTASHSLASCSSPVASRPISETVFFQRETEPAPGDSTVVQSVSDQAENSAAFNIEEFRLYLSARNMSKNTIHVYAYAIRQFFSLYRDMTYSNLKLYKVFLLEHYKPQTVNLRIRALNSYIEFREMEPGRLPMVRIQQKNYLDNVISEADYEYLKNCLIRDQKYLYYFIIRFMAATGSRVSEVIQFKAEDIFAGYKDIYSKGNKVRRIYVPKALQKSTLTWLKSIQRDRGYIFLNRYGNPISPGGIRGQLKQMAVTYGMNPEVVHPHSFRHRFAKSFIERCGDLSLLSDLLGHKNLETTRIYLRRSSTEQYEIVNKVVNW